MNKKIFLVKLFFAFFIFSLNSREGFTILQSDAGGVTIQYIFSGFYKKPVTIGKHTYYHLWSDQTVPVLDAGNPEILRSSIALAIPSDCVPTWEIMEHEFYTESQVPVAPSKGSLTRNINPLDVPYTFGPIYSQNRFYPESLISIDQSFNYRHVNGISLSVYPIRYNPAEKKIEVVRKMVFRIRFYDKKKKKVNNLEIPVYHSMEEKFLLESRFANLSSLTRQSKLNYTPLNEYGDMLVIAAPTLTAPMIPFIYWKNQKGIKTTMVTTAITGTSQSSIQSYIANEYNSNQNLLYVLLVGDHQNIPAFNDGIKGSETKWSDIKYGMITGGPSDYYPELMVGRFSSTLTTDIQTMVNRTLEYEKNPQSGNWFSTGIGIGSNEGYGIGDDGEPDWLHIRNIGQKLVSGAGYTYFHEFFDSTHGGNDAPGDPTSAMVSAAVNSGASVFLYAGHGSQNTCVTSNFNITAINSCTNNGKYPFSVQVACNNGTFHNGTCFSEAFTRAKNANGPTGAIASCGSSILMAWAEPMQTQDEIGDIISNQYPNNKKYTLGGLFYCGQMSMLDKYPTTTGKEVMATWIMFGDPSCMFRSASPVPLAVQHTSCIAPNAGSFQVQVNQGAGTYICISQNNQILGRTAANGTLTIVSLTQTFSTTQPLLITVTEYNKLPYQATLVICPASPTSLQDIPASENFLEYNTLVSDFLKIKSEKRIESVKILDYTGKILKQFSCHASDISISASDLPDNAYILQIQTDYKIFYGKFLKIHN